MSVQTLKGICKRLAPVFYTLANFTCIMKIYYPGRKEMVLLPSSQINFTVHSPGSVARSHVYFFG